MTAMGNKYVIAFVFALLLAGGPPAVVFGIPFGIVNPFKSKAFGFAHVLKESGKGFPMIANRDTTAAIIRKGPAFGVPASLDHGRPHLIGFGSGPSVGHIASNKFMQPTAAAFSISGGEIVGWHNRILSAITQALPLRQCLAASSDRFAPRAGQSDEFPEPLSGDVYCVWHDALYNGVTYTST